MAKYTKPDYIKRAIALEIDQTGDETIGDLKTLIQSEMESLDTWDGDHFTDKAEEPAAEEETNAEQDEQTDTEATEETQEGEEAEAAEEAEELTEEQLEELKNTNTAAVEDANAKERKALCVALDIERGGKTAVLAERLLGYEDHDAQQLAAALKAAGLGVEEHSAEAEKSRALRERRNKLEELKEEGVDALISSMRLLIAIEQFEDALGIAQIGKELWPKNTDLADRKKSIETQIKVRDAAASAHELKVQQEKLEKKNKKRGRKAKVSTIQDCVDACNELIVVTKATEKALALDGKANRRLLYAQTILGRLLKNQYR